MREILCKAQKSERWVSTYLSWTPGQALMWCTAATCAAEEPSQKRRKFGNKMKAQEEANDDLLVKSKNHSQSSQPPSAQNCFLCQCPVESLCRTDRIRIQRLLQEKQAWRPRRLPKMYPEWLQMKVSFSHAFFRPGWTHYFLSVVLLDSGLALGFCSHCSWQVLEGEPHADGRDSRALHLLCQHHDTAIANVRRSDEDCPQSKPGYPEAKDMFGELRVAFASPPSLCGCGASHSEAGGGS